MLVFVGFYFVLFTSNYAVEVNAKPNPDLIVYEIYKSGKLVPVPLTKKRLIKEIEKMAPKREALFMSLPLPTPVSAQKESLFSALREKINNRRSPPTSENGKPSRRHKRDSESGFERVIIVRRESNDQPEHEKETTEYTRAQSDFNEHSIFSEAENKNTEPEKTLIHGRQDLEGMSIEFKTNEVVVSPPDFTENENNKVKSTTVSAKEKIDIKHLNMTVPPLKDEILPSTIALMLKKDEPYETREGKKPMIIELPPQTISGHEENDKNESTKVSVPLREDKEKNEELPTTKAEVADKNGVESDPTKDMKIDLQIDLKTVNQTQSAEYASPRAVDVNSVAVATTPEVTTVETTTWTPIVLEYVEGGAS